MKALALLSGGLDSILAVKLILDQGINVVALNFVTPFSELEKNRAEIQAKRLKIPLKTIKLGKYYIKIIRNPKHGYGKNMNPCIDCRIFMLKRAKEYAKKIKASFIFTGEILDERPMTQTRKALDLIEKESGLKRKLLRPLSARLLPETEAEMRDWIDRKKLLDIIGRQRKRQIELAKKFRITDYPNPGGGCLLTYKEFAVKVRDLFKYKKGVSIKDINFLKIGRHFRFKKNKIIVGRNKDENKLLLRLKGKDDYFFKVLDFGSPITILQGPQRKEAIEMAASLTARYSDAKKKKILVNYGEEKLSKSITISPLTEKEIKNLRIG
jgi:tRNA-specific 2-thiouridylase